MSWIMAEESGPRTSGPRLHHGCHWHKHTRRGEEHRLRWLAGKEKTRQEAVSRGDDA